MHAELPWNVAGIPPEAREAARAAARREGLSVGEWLTRRILRSFSGMEVDAAPVERAHLDAWGLPQSDASRRDTEDMLARVGRSEAESSEAFRRIEEQLRGLSRRLDSSERSHSESNRVLSRTAQEINIASREQAQAFDQMSMNVMALAERLERVERAAAHDGIREAVKGLHLGLSRLADQVSQTANQSATQVSNLANSLEQLASRLAETRVDSEDADKQLAQRVVTVENAAHKNAAQLEDRLATLELRAGEGLETLNRRLAAIQDGAETGRAELEQRLTAIQDGAESGRAALEQRLTAIQDGAESGRMALEQRLTAVEKTVQVHTNAIDHALEKVEATANARASDQVELQRRAAFVEENLQGLRDAIMRLEADAPHAATQQRLDALERHLGGLMDRLENDAPATLQQSLDALTRRIEILEKDHNDLLAEVRTGDHIPGPAPAFEPSDTPQAEDVHPAGERPPGAFEAPPFPEAEPGLGYSTEAQASFQPDPFFDDSDDGAHQFLYGADSAEQAPAAEPPLADGFEPHFDPDEPSPTEPENFLAQARRTARAAAEKAESERQDRGLRWGRPSIDVEAEESRSRYVIPAVIALIMVLAVAAGLVLSQRARQAVPGGSSGTAPVKTTAPGPNNSLPQKPSADTKQLVVGPSATPDQSQTSPTSPPPQAGQEPAPAPAPPAKVQEQTVRPAPVKPVPSSRPAPRQSQTERVIQLANANNSIAETILGLRYLDGTDGAPVNLSQAVKYLTAAANQGQAVAQYRLGTLYERGQGVPADGAKAAHWYQLAANQGNRKAMHNLAVAFASGSVGNKNMAEAARWFAKAAALGLSDSQFNLAVLYERGDGVPQSLLDAYKWYSIAAASGDAESKARVAVLRSQLSDSDRAAAEKSAASFHAAPLNRSANVPPEPADLG